MGPWTGCLVACLLALACATEAAAGAEPEAARAFQAATRAFEREDYESALAGFRDARAAGMDDAAVGYNIAVCLYRLGRFEEAAAEFRDLARRHPRMRALARYNLGLALLRQGRSAEARAEFERALSAEDATITRLARAALDRMEPAGAEREPRPVWFGLVDIGIGRDDNVALVEDSSVLLGVPTSSALAEVLGFVSGPLPFGRRLRLDASAYAVTYPDARRFDQEALQIDALYHREFSAWTVEAGPRYGYSTLDGAGFERRIGAALELGRPLADGVELELRIAHDDIGSVHSRYDFVEGTRSRLGVNLERRWAARRLELEYEIERNDRLSANVEPRRHAISVVYSQPLAENWSARLRGRFRASRYNELEVPREEDLSELTATASRALPSGWQLDAEYHRASNDSNAVAYSYERDRVAVAISKIF